MKREDETTKEAIFKRISFIIKEQMNKPDMKITQTTSLHDDLGVDSIALMEFIINLEDEFRLEIPDEDVENMKCMGEMMEYLYDCVNQSKTFVNFERFYFYFVKKSAKC